MKQSDGGDERPGSPSPGNGEPILEFYAQVGAWQHGPLYDDLARLPKGRRRAERLRMLAYAGLLVEQEKRNGNALHAMPRPAPPRGSSSAGGIFDDPLPE